MNVLLHIGQSKTGTSAIQAFLTLNHDRLARARIIYPSVRVRGVNVHLGSHNAVADAIVGKQRYPFLSAEEYAEQFFSESRESHANRIIISGEHFFGGEPRIWEVASEQEYFDRYRDKVRRVGIFLRRHQTEILLYLRPQVGWLESGASQTIRIQGLLSRKDVYQNDRQFYEMMKPLLRYGRLLDIWQEEMPSARIVAVPYVRSQLANGDSISDFLHRAELDPSNLKLGRAQLSINDSISREFLEVKKVLNLSRHSSVREHVIIACLRRLSRDSRFSARYTLPADIVREVVELAEEENAIVNAKYVCDGGQLSAVGEDGRMAAEPTPEDVTVAMTRFEAEFAKPRYRIMEMDYAVRALLRRHARPVHGALHQLKRLYRAAAYRRA